jgi:hypothetical protein
MGWNDHIDDVPDCAPGKCRYVPSDSCDHFWPCKCVNYPHCARCGRRKPEPPKPNVLDCLFCPKLFPDFDALADHVQRVHNVPDRSAPDRAVATQAQTGKRTMAKQTSSNPAFITAEDLDRKGRTKAKIEKSISVFHRDDGKTSLFIGITVNGEKFTLGVRCGSPDRIALQNVIGRNIIDWPGKTIELYASEGSQGGTFVNVYDPSRNRR